MFKIIGISILTLIGILVLGFVLNLAGFAQFAFFAPKIVQVQNKVFQESQQYNESMVRDLSQLEQQYITATPVQKDSLRALTIHRFEVYDINKLPPDLQNFYNSLKQSNQGN